MPSPTTADGSEDVNDFLQRIKELGDKRDQEDELRTKKLEEEILQGRKERQARRAERARSISPTKSSPANTPTVSRVSTFQDNNMSPAIDPTPQPESQRDTASDNAMDRLTGHVTSPTKDNSPQSDIAEDTKRNYAMKSSPSSAVLSRNSPLSWQRRPNSRPLSMVASENAARSPRATPEPSSATEPSFSRDQIAQSLATKDPAWFRQTADRGLNSPAYRKNQVEDEDRSEHGSNHSRIQMPGMSREVSQEEKAAEQVADRSRSPSRASAIDGTSLTASYLSKSKPINGLGSPMSLTPAQKLDPPTESRSESRSFAMSPSQGRISPERLDRPASPTKGMGGFVQSAMMKRSDSVNKRWSVQPPAGLSRGDSVASNRSSVNLGNIGSTTTREIRPTSLSRENSPRAASRPTSSHSNATVTQDRPGTASSMRSSITTSTADAFAKPTLPTSRTQTPLGLRTTQPEGLAKESDTTPPSSPSKTMDPRRWSPTKSSWLESALNKPESPKPKVVAPHQQPSWMSEISKAKQKGSVDLGRNTTTAPKHEVNIGGLMRSPPPGGLTKPLSLSAIPGGFSTGSIPMSRPGSVTSQTSSDFSKLIKSPETTGPSSLAPTSLAAVTKVKPETPPKKDFRASLKSRPTQPENGSSNEPEFKNVFGQLRRTKTQNYVAPDELKDNITRGKAALSLTGGPKKTEHQDEFKDAILKKKDDFKKAQLEGKGIVRSPSGGNQEATIPEALAKRRLLGRSGSIVSDTNSAVAESPVQQRAVSPSPKPSLIKESSAPGRLQGKDLAVSKLAGRLNPGLAGLLARGPPPASGDGARTSISESLVESSTSISSPSEPGPQLTHMTKGRARGPRRKAPSSTPIATSSFDAGGDTYHAKVDNASFPGRASRQETSTTSITAAETPDFSSRTLSDAQLSQPSSPQKLDMKRRSQFLQETSAKQALADLKPKSPKVLSPSKNVGSFELPRELQSSIDIPPTPKTKPTTPIKSTSLITKTTETSPVTSPIESHETARLRTLLLSPTKLNNSAQMSSTSSTKHRPLPLSPSRTSQVNENLEMQVVEEHPVLKVDTTGGASGNVRSAAASWNRPSSTNLLQSSHARSPIKLPTHEDEKAAMVGAGLRSPSPTEGRGSVPARPLPVPPTKVLSPPLSAGLSPSLNSSRSLADFFSERTPPTEFKVDTATLLASRPDHGENFKTLRASLYQISSDGQKQQVPAHQERILFEGNAYLCTHTFGNSAGKKVTEVYFWYGDSVPKSTVERLEAIAHREARNAGGKLVTIRQGKETPELFHALGGIVIIRRGSSNKYDSLAPHILCCRKHLGQIVFDEVDFSPVSLCSGFPYLISTQSGKSYLWKGRGSGIEELSCARLIGMDFGLTGEIEEVEDGSEPATFLEIFGPGTVVPKSADHWRMKPNYNKYSIRMFRADSRTKEQVTELNPFCQTDLDWSNIFILDAFFEIYIIVGSNSQKEYSSFQHALLFAQEYGMLAAGMEDRPFIPITTVVLEGVPKDMRSVFRKWVPELSPTTFPTTPSGSLQRGRSLRVLPLNAALEATRS